MAFHGSLAPQSFRKLQYLSFSFIFDLTPTTCVPLVFLFFFPFLSLSLIHTFLTPENLRLGILFKICQLLFQICPTFSSLPFSDTNTCLFAPMEPN